MRIKVIYDKLLRQVFYYIFEEENGKETLIDAIPLLDEEGEDEETTIH